MSFTLLERKVGDVTVLKPVGQLTRAEIAILKERLQDLFRKQHYRIVVDLSVVTYITSHGYRCLVDASTTALQHSSPAVLNCDVRLAALNKQLTENEFTKASAPFFRIFGSVEEAIKSFQVVHA